MKIRKNDLVMVIAGNSRGKRGKVLKVYPDLGRVIIEGVNLIKRHTRPNQKNPHGGIVQREEGARICGSRAGVVEYGLESRRGNDFGP